MVAVRSVLACLLMVFVAVAPFGRALAKHKPKRVGTRFQLSHGPAARRSLFPSHVLTFSLDPWARTLNSLIRVVPTQVEVPLYARWTLVSPVLDNSAVSAFLRYRF